MIFDLELGILYFRRSRTTRDLNSRDHNPNELSAFSLGGLTLT